MNGGGGNRRGGARRKGGKGRGGVGVGTVHPAKGDVDSTWTKTTTNRAEIGTGRGALHDRGGRGGAGGKLRDRQMRPVEFRALEDILKQNERVLLLTIQDEFFGFKQLLKVGKYTYDMLVTVISVISKASGCDSCPENVMQLLNDALSSSIFTADVPRYLATAPHDTNEATRLRTVIFLLVPLFERLLERFPNKASEILGIAFVTIRDVATRFENVGTPLEARLSQKIKDLDKLRGENLAKYDAVTRNKLTREETEAAQTPPSDFRSMSIFPTVADVHEILHPFLRPNIISGKYNNVSHYLDIHFRLMREDFVAPLRDGLTKYLVLVKSGRTKDLKQKDIKVYSDVRIVMAECSANDGVLHRLSFNISKLKNVRWESTRRLMYGSLICLSSDNFQTFILGIIINREAKLLLEGYVTVRLVGVQNVFTMNSNKVYLMAESPAYFEAYSPILRGLQSMDDDSLPFSQYLINAATNVGVPRYLTDASTYEFKPLMASHLSRRCRLLDENSWPTAEELSLDKNQYLALKHCLTKEIAIVQGPPGTGKTFLGLKVVEMLLNNHGSDVPILIVCYTNHALDQFLEGIFQYERNIVRIGSRSKSEAMEMCNLGQLRKVASQDRGLPAYVYFNRKAMYEQLRVLRFEIADEMELLLAAEMQILHEDMLRPFMKGAHVRQLQNENYVHGRRDSAILDWLCLSGAFFVEVPNVTELQVDDEDDDRESLEEDALAEEEMARRFQDHYFEEDNDMQPFVNIAGRMQKRELKHFAEVHKEGEWQVAGKAKKMKRMVNHEMKNTDVMTEAEENMVFNIWTLSLPNRWRLYRQWVSKLRHQRLASVNDKQAEYETTYQRLKEVLRELDVAIVQKAKVVGMTTTGAAKSREMLQIVSPTIVVVEEAAEVLESHIITALTSRCEHLILIGDQQQLRPNPTVYRLAKDYKLDVSLFERLIRNGMPYERLQTQHRMRPRIAELLVPHIYETLLNHPSVEKYEFVKGTVSSVFFVNHHQVESTVSDTSSRANEFEAKFLIALCRHLLLQGYRPEQITILSTYLGQVFLIKKLIKATIGKDVRCTVVDNFQGEENDIILLSLVRSNAEGHVGFLKVDNRVCVALSRAKMGLFCIGNFDFLSENATIWKPIVDSLKRDKLIGARLELKCENHPNVITEVGSHADFHLSPEGGCGLPCDYRLSCGHKCPKVCHFYDAEHTKVVCMKPCEKLCEFQHKCNRRCNVECGPCLVIVLKRNPICGHFNNVACHKHPESMSCRNPCNKFLSCGHLCQKYCGELCNNESCHVKIERVAICGHTVRVSCSQSKLEKSLLEACTSPCYQPLSCGHLCSGNCRDCHQGRMHVRCNENCGRRIVCGHPCNVPCAQNCPPCIRPCENRCIHSKCKLKCGFPCKPCMEPCAWRCEHLACTKLCHEPCDRDPCNEPCTMMLPCGHSCIGFCGEPCPKQCRECNREEVCELIFGTEDEEDARFVLLEDCGHVIESGAMDYYMKQDTCAAGGTQHAVIEMKKCPKCTTIIRKTFRYSTQVNQVLGDVIAIKSRIFGDIRDTKNKLQTVKQRVRNIVKSYEKYPSKLRDCTVKLAHETKDCHSLTELTTVDNLVTLLEDMAKQWNTILGHVSCSSAREKLMELKDWFLELNKHSSHNQVNDFSREFQRVLMLSSLLQGAERNTMNDRAKPCYDNIVLYLTDLTPFTEILEEEVRRKLNELRQLQSGLGISEVEKREILTALGMGQGHWFKCPNGHIYVITECGGAMEEGRCNECGAAVGGGSHRLLSTNSIATEMDGATRPSWPTMLQGRF